jgi:RNA polymerase sigma-70 factor (sigma-E family)
VAEASHKYVESNPSEAPAVLLAPRLGGPRPVPVPTQRAQSQQERAEGDARAEARERAEARDAEAAVTELYHAHSLGLTRLAHVMLGDRPGAEDVVQDAFYGLYRHYPRLTDKRKALPYLRSSVLNGCRTELRRNRRRNAARLREGPADDPAARTEPSAEAAVMADEDRHAVLAAIMRLPHRQRAVLVLRYYLDEPEAVIAESLGITSGTVRSTLHRALAKLGADLKGTP